MYTPESLPIFLLHSLHIGPCESKQYVEQEEEDHQVFRFSPFFQAKKKPNIQIF